MSDNEDITILFTILFILHRIYLAT